MTGEIVEIPLSELKVTFFVRAKVNEDHVLYLAELYESGVELPPIEVIEGVNEIKDGRHRFGSMQLLGWTKAKCMIVEAKDQNEMLAEAFKANMGGALPPSREDILMIVRKFLENGLTQKRIKELLGGSLKPSMVNTYIRTSKSSIAKAKMQNALRAVAEGELTAPKAAEQYGVDLQNLKDEIKGKKKKRKMNSVKQIKNLMSRTCQGNTRKVTAQIDKLIERFLDGEATSKEVFELFEKAEHLQKHAMSTLADKRKRFEEQYLQ